MQDSGFIIRGSGFKVRELRLSTLDPRLSTLRTPHSSFRNHHSGFTLVELLVTIAIIGVVAGMSLGALQWGRKAAAEAKTKATIAKLDAIIMEKYESYFTRRVPINTSGMHPKAAALARLNAIRDLMRMEMPERWNDIDKIPVSGIARPALSTMYLNKITNSPPDTSSGKEHYSSAKLLYMIVSMSDPEAMEQFRQDEIGMIDNDGYPVFLDGWGMPIMFLRWAPGFIVENNAISDIQTRNAQLQHDPFDTHRVNPSAYQLIPLIYSAGPDKKLGLLLDDPSLTSGYFYDVTTSKTTINPYAVISSGMIGTPVDNEGENAHIDNITNHSTQSQ